MKRESSPSKQSERWRGSNENGDLDHLEHAWCLTCHKAQGSSSKVVVVGLDGRGYYMAKRNWLYTAITRASELLVICCEPYMINKAIKDDEVLKKRTLLKDFLVQNYNSLI